MRTIYNTKHITWIDDGNTSLCYFEFFMDSAADLPSDLYCFSSDSARYKIAQGSIAYDIATSDAYMVNSSGAWIKQ
jgi:hypothetical protein